MDPAIADKLLSFQIAHTLQLSECLQGRNCVLDASDTGTGKTYCAVALCRILGKIPFIICPKSVINTWGEVCGIFGIHPFGIANYEMLRGGKYMTEDLDVVQCPYIDKIVAGGDQGGKTDFVFQLPPEVIVIFDEAHRCKNSSTGTSRLLLSAGKTGNKILLLSATISDKIDCFRPFGVVFRLYDRPQQYKPWMRRQLLIRRVGHRDRNLSDDEKKLDVIYRTVFPAMGSRMRIRELGDLFPQNHVTSQCYYLANHKEVDDLHREVNLAIQELRDKEKRAEALAKIVRARQRIELLKVPIFQDLAQEALDNGYSVAIFVNYRETMDQLCAHLETSCVIHGDQTLEERTGNIADFQENRSRKIISIVQAGGVGVSLHDLHGHHPRMSIISPSWSGQDLVQVLGRIHRARALTPAIQKIVYCAKTYEEKICELVKSKIRNLSAINDGDLASPAIPTEKIGEVNGAEDESFRYKARRPTDP